MGQLYNNDHFPILESLGDKYVYKYHVPSQTVRLERLSRADRNASLEDSMDMIADLLKKYQTLYTRARDNKWEVWMPYLFIEPSAGDKVKNTRTGEIYTIVNVLRDPATKAFYGNIILSGTNAPDPLTGDCLEILDNTRYVRFVEEAPDREVGDVREINSGAQSTLPPMNPTVSYVLIRQEPGSYGPKFFSNIRKEWKPRFREVFPDPERRGFTIEVHGQLIDSLVQFDCWSNDARSARRLVTWFEHFMRENVWILLKNGVNEIFFWAKLRDENTVKWRQDAYARSIQYAFRTEYIEAFRRRDLLRVNVNAEIKNSLGQTQTHKLGNTGIEYTGPLTPKVYRSLFFDQSGNYRFGNYSIIDDGGSNFD